MVETKCENHTPVIPDVDEDPKNEDLPTEAPDTPRSPTDWTNDLKLEENDLMADNVRAAIEGFDDEEEEDKGEEGEHRGSEEADVLDNRGGRSQGPPEKNRSTEFDPKRIFVGRLVKGMSAQRLQDVVERHFSSFGVVEKIVLPVDSATGLSKGFSFISFTDPAAVDLVLSCPHVIDEVEVDCKPAYPRNSTKGLQDLAEVPGTLFKTRKIFIGGLPSSVTDSEVIAHYSRYGQVISGRVIRDKRTGHSRSFGFVEFASEASVDKSMAHFSSHYLGGRWIMSKRASMSPPKEKSNLASLLEPAVRNALLRSLSCRYDLPRRPVEGSWDRAPPPPPLRERGHYRYSPYNRSSYKGDGCPCCRHDGWSNRSHRVPPSDYRRYSSRRSSDSYGSPYYDDRGARSEDVKDGVFRPKRDFKSRDNPRRSPSPRNEPDSVRWEDRDFRTRSRDRDADPEGKMMRSSRRSNNNHRWNRSNGGPSSP